MKKIKRHNRTIFLLIFTITTILSCSKDFLNEPENTAGLPESIVFSEREIIESFESGIYDRYKSQWDNDLGDGVNNSSPDTGGLYAQYFARTVKGNDLIQAVTIFRFDYGHENREPNFRRTSFAWEFNYEIINYANIIIRNVASSDLDENTKKEFIAVGKVFRAFHYFQLALEFAPNYNNDRSVAKIPVYTSPATGSTIPAKPSPLSEVYALIINDLKEAILDLPEERLGKSYIRKSVANGILARVLQVTQDDWALASASARAAYGGNSASAVVSTNWRTGFSDLSDQEWLWGHFQNGSNETNFFWMSPHPFFDHLVLSYNGTYINPNFRDQFSSTDIRNNFFNLYNVEATEPWREFVSTKFSFAFTSDVPLMRKSEMVLIDAEAQYQLGNELEAKNLLFTLQSNRDSNAVMSATTGQALLNEILLERRKEMYGEFGVEWFDAKRYRLPINRDPVHRIPMNIPADSELFVLKIPESETDANPNMDTSINDDI
ncbi:RagB/SusD family nutrient uptake outer membrane protein [uncultured Algibacter sp.]|jgi:hypothetical protein|uniref:RagB/SusD family nutrient uptake outer membrane protein n=1 Tax=uncultured Algibacter sp. TaxID=298659 RepID=UPI0026190E0F|nr:RagB/SusD family nutrient uptake outer membrane protein [uncultured Algibacter sp.]